VKKLYLIIVFLTVILPAFANDDHQEIGFFVFSSNSANRLVNEDAGFQLDNMARNLMERNLAEGQILVYGYCAIFANHIDPANLSGERALFIVNELQKRGVPGALFSDPVAAGEVDFWGDNASEEGRRPNRRARVLIDRNIAAALFPSGGLGFGH
jgi:outer membrane protein OmpA-like peptidoglycan-associated protein